MSSILAVASRHADWLATRRATVAANIANANTPGYRTREIEAFTLELANETEPSNSQAEVMGGSPFAVTEATVRSRTAQHSGNNVALDVEMLKAGEVAREQNLNNAVVKSFYRLIALSVRS